MHPIMSEQGGWYGMVKQLGLLASLLAGRIAQTPLGELTDFSFLT